MKYQQCIKCIMDTTDPDISFNDNGLCSHCINFEENQKPNWYPNQEGEKKLQKIFNDIKKKSLKKEYDCILGLSGGVDSSYLALKIKDAGLKPLLIHVDGGWNTELAVHNIERIIDYCDWDLHTIVIDWEEMRELQLAYMKSGICDQDVPQDHAFFTCLYHYSIKHGIKYIINGGNIATECVLPKGWGSPAMDCINLKAIFKKYGHGKLKKFKTISFFEMYFYYPFIRKMKVIRPLNYMIYNKSEALKELQIKIGYKPYRRKHGESIFTKFFQNYFLVKRYGYDKRLCHLSSMIITGLITRDEAIEKMREPLYDVKELENDKDYIASKLDISIGELNNLLDVPKHSYKDFPNFKKKYVVMQKLRSIVERLLKIRIIKYS